MKKTCICKQSYEHTSGYYIVDFEKNKIYEYKIYYSYPNSILEYKHYIVYNEDYEIHDEQCIFTPELFYKYFIDLQKLRKIKLEKLNEVQGWG